MIRRIMGMVMEMDKIMDVSSHGRFICSFLLFIFNDSRSFPCVHAVDGDSTDYGYGDSQEGGEKTEPAPTPEQKPGTRRRRNSVVIRKDNDPLAVADYLMGGDPNKKESN